MADSPRIEELKRRVQSDPASIAFAALAEEYRRAGRFEEAIDTCAAGLVRHPSYLSAHVTLGRALIDVGRLEDAKRELESVLKLAPENLAAIRGLAEIHDRLRDAPPEHQSAPERAVGEALDRQMTVAEIHAASGFKPPEPDHETQASASPTTLLEQEIPALAPAAAAEPEPAALSQAYEPVMTVAPRAADLPSLAVEPRHVQLPPEEDPALAGLEEFLNAIMRARAERAAR